MADFGAALDFSQQAAAAFRRHAGRICILPAGPRRSLYCVRSMNLEVDVERLTLAHKAVRRAIGRASGRRPLDWPPRQLAVCDRRGRERAGRRPSPRFAARAWKSITSGDDQVIEQVVQGDLSELLLESVHWLARHQNPDGGWGDCEGARSNIAATMMVQAAFRLTGIPAKYADLMDRCRRLRRSRKAASPDCAATAMKTKRCWPRSWPIVRWPTWFRGGKCQRCSSNSPACRTRWQRDMQCLCPRYATPVVLAVGRAKFHHDPPKNPISRLLRRSIWKKSLTILEQLQAADDSFLASVPLTAFVVMSLGSVGCQDHTIVRRGIEFLLSSLRAIPAGPTHRIGQYRTPHSH